MTKTGIAISPKAVELIALSIMLSGLYAQRIPQGIASISEIRTENNISSMVIGKRDIIAGKTIP